LQPQLRRLPDATKDKNWPTQKVLGMVVYWTFLVDIFNGWLFTFILLQAGKLDLCLLICIFTRLLVCGTVVAFYV